MKDDNFIINVKVGGFRLPLNIARKDEEVYRNAEKRVNKLLLDYQQKYNQRSAEEVLSITAYQLAVALSKQDFVQNTSPVVEKIEQLDKELEKTLSKNQ
jgi:cell division protein ZapA